MADYFDSAQTQADASKAALLAAITQYGSQAHQALQAGQDQLAAARQAAIGQQLGTGQQMDAPAALQNELSARIGAPYDQRIASLGTEAASRQAGFDNQASAANTYMTEANAALPAIRGQLATKVATLQAQAQAQLEKDRQDQAMQALTFQQGQALKNIELQIAQANLAKAQTSGAAGDASLSSILGKLGGADLAGGQLAAGVSDAADQPDLAAVLGLGLPPVASLNSLARTDPSAAAGKIGTRAGLPESVGSQLYDQYNQKQNAAATKGQPSPGSSEAIRQNPAYAQAVNDFINGAALIGKPPAKGSPKGAKPLTETDVFNALVQQYGPDVARQVIGDYARALPSASTLP